MIPAIFIPGRREDLRNYTAAVYFAGGIPICSTDSADSALCSGLLLPGGGDIGEKLDGEEEKLIQSFVQRERPILGICRGDASTEHLFRRQPAGSDPESSAAPGRPDT